MVNRQVWLRSRPNGIPQASDFAIRESAIPPIADGEFLVRNSFLSADPAMRGWIADKTSYMPRIEVGETMRAFAVGAVLESKNPRYVVGAQVMGLFGWQDYAAAQETQVMRKVRETALPRSLSLGVLGLNGLTAYFGVLDVLRPKAGETVIVSTAAGGVGSAAGQIAKLRRCRVVGVTGGGRRRLVSALRNSATTPSLTTKRPPISIRHSVKHAPTASMPSSTTRPERSTMRCFGG
jgi:NADPH-dependent curcumin reductase CurA